MTDSILGEPEPFKPPETMMEHFQNHYLPLICICLLLVLLWIVLKSKRGASNQDNQQARIAEAKRHLREPAAKSSPKRNVSSCHPPFVPAPRLPVAVAFPSEDIMTTPEIIRPVSVTRTGDGYWCHPALSAFYGDREYVDPADYEQWLTERGLEDNMVFMDDEVGSIDDPEWLRQADFSLWSPPAPDGEGWFIGAIYEDEDNGSLCIWLRHREVSCAE